MYLMLLFDMKLELHARLATYLLSFDILSKFAPVTSVCSELAREPKEKDHALLPSLSAFQVAALGHSFPLFAHSFSAKSFACHSYEYPRGWPPSLATKCADSCTTTNTALLRSSSDTASPNSSSSAKVPGINTYKNRTHKSFRIRTYKKTGRGCPAVPLSVNEQRSIRAKFHIGTPSQSVLSSHPTGAPTNRGSPRE